MQRRNARKKLLLYILNRFENIVYNGLLINLTAYRKKQPLKKYPQRKGNKLDSKQSK